MTDFLSNDKKDAAGKSFGYLSDIYIFASLLIIFAFFAYIFWARLGTPIPDGGREAYIPSQILAGKILYKDIFVLYGPFSYQINALLFRFFGQHLEILYMAGLINSLILLTTIYLLARTVTTKCISWTICFVVMTICFFNYYISNFIYPYSYGMIYSLSSFVLSLLFCVYYIKYFNPIYAVLSFFFLGISFFSKVDFALFLTVLLAVILVLKPLNKKYLAISFIAFLSVPFLCSINLFLSGLNIFELMNYFSIFHSFLTSSGFNVFLNNSTGAFINSDKLIINIYCFMIILLYLITSIGTFYSILKVLFAKTKTIFKVLAIFAFPIATFILFSFFLAIFKNNNLYNLALSWIVILATLILILIGKRNISGRTLKDEIFILISISGIIAALRSYFLINIHIYGPFFMIVALITNIIFLTDYMPYYLKSVDKNIWNKACILSLTMLGIIYFSIYQNFSKNILTHPVKNEKGIIYVRQDMEQVYDGIIEFIRKNTSKNDFILVINDGSIFNFLTDRTSDNWLYNLNPDFIEAVGEKKIILRLKNNPPDYIIILDNSYLQFGKDFGKKIYSYILGAYALESDIGHGQGYKIFKIKMQ